LDRASRRLEHLPVTILNRPDAADKTDSGAKYCVGLADLRGRNTRQDYGQAAAWFGKAASQNHPGALAALGYLHENGKGMPPDPAKAFDYYRRSAEQGNGEAAYFARWLSDPTNNVGFRNQQEQLLSD
jgi:TPR repeat protein